MTPFAVRFSMASPVILQSPFVTLDGILAATSFRAVHTLEEFSERIRLAHALPLLKTNDTYHASQAILEYPFTVSEESLTKSYDYEMARNNRMAQFTDLIQFGRKSIIPVIKTEYSLVMNTYPLYDAKYVWFFGCGDVERVAYLLKFVNHIGKKSRTGSYGKVNSWTIYEMTEDCSIYSPEDTPWLMRRVGTDFPGLEACDTASYSTLRTTVTLPYTPEYGGVPVYAKVPLHRNMLGYEITDIFNIGEIIAEYTP